MFLVSLCNVKSKQFEFSVIVDFWKHILAFLDTSQDSFGRLHDRGKEVPKATKLMTKLFPNKVTIHMPQVLHYT